LLHPLYVADRQTRPTARVAPFASQGCQAALIETPLLPPHGASAVTEHPRHIVLIGPTLFDQTDHGVRFSHPVSDCILRQDDPRNDDDAVSALGSHQTSIVDDP
jgi:hypothetical protein